MCDCCTGAVREVEVRGVRTGEASWPQYVDSAAPRLSYADMARQMSGGPLAGMMSVAAVLQASELQICFLSESELGRS